MELRVVITNEEFEVLKEHGTVQFVLEVLKPGEKIKGDRVKFIDPAGNCVIARIKAERRRLYTGNRATAVLLPPSEYNALMSCEEMQNRDRFDGMEIFYYSGTEIKFL